VPDHDSFIEQIASELRRPVRLDPRFDDRVMRAIEMPDIVPLRPSPSRPWILRPWTISAPPIAFAVAAALIVAVSLGVRHERSGAAAAPLAAAPAVQMVPVALSPNEQMHQFLLLSPSAHKVAVVGDFNDWDASRTPLTRLSNEGAWSIALPLTVGFHEFQYVIDDSIRITDPSLPKEPNGFGSENSVITIGARENK
jgi:hypothetical protein